MSTPTTILKMTPAPVAQLKTTVTKSPSMRLTPQAKPTLTMRGENGEISRLVLEPTPALGLSLNSSEVSLKTVTAAAAMLIIRFGVATGTSGGSSAFSVMANPPTAGDGENGDCVLAISDGGFYYKLAGTWSLIGKIFTVVTNVTASVVTPSAGLGTVQLSTPPP